MFHPTAPTSDPRSVLLTTFHWMLRRLVRLALTFGMTYPTLEVMLKRCYLESATEDFALAGSPQTDSRLTLLTGMNRSDLRRLRVATASAEPLPLSLEWRVALRWLAAPYTDAMGRPAPLRRSASAGGGQSFEALVQAVNTDIRGTAVLQQWLELGYVRVDDATGDVHFDKVAFFNRLGEAEDQTALLASVVGDLIQGYIDNMPNPAQRPLYVRSLWLDRLTQESVQLLNDAARQQIDSAEALFAQGTALEAADRGNPGARHRFRYCAFSYRASIDRDPALPFGN